MTFEQRYYDTTEISKILNIHLNTVRNYIRAGELKAVKIARAWKVEGAELERFVKEGASKDYWQKYHGTQARKEG